MARKHIVSIFIECTGKRKGKERHIVCILYHQWNGREPAFEKIPDL